MAAANTSKLEFVVVVAAMDEITLNIGFKGSNDFICIPIPRSATAMNLAKAIPGSELKLQSLRIFKPNDPQALAVAPLETLHQRMRALGDLGEWCSIWEPMEEAGDTFYQNISREHVNIVVRGWYPDSPLPSTGLSDPPAWAFDAYTKFWVDQQDPIVESDGIRRLAIDCGSHPIYIRQEYIVLWDLIHKDREELIETECTNTGGAIILGQPGIGKSLFLKYALLQALKARIPTIFCEKPHTFTLFDGNGVRTRRTEGFSSSAKVLALCDSDSDVQAPPRAFRDSESHAYIVQATSPLFPRWAKYRGAYVVLMNGWEHQEANDLFKLRNIRQPDGYYQPMELFKYFAPVVRDCFLRYQKQRNDMLEDTGLVDTSMLFDTAGELGAFLHYGALPSGKKPDYLYRYFYVSRPPDAQLELRPYVMAHGMLSKYQIPNPFLVSLIATSLADQTLQQQQDFLRIVSPYPNIAGPVFESFAVNWLASSKVSSLTSTLLNGEKLEIPLKLSRLDLSDLSELKIKDNAIYVPEPNFPTLDAVAVSQKRVISLQIPVTKFTDQLQGGGIRTIWTKFGHQATNYEWYFIFFVPSEEDGKRLAGSTCSSENIPVPVPAGDRPAAERHAQQRMGLQIGYAVLEDIQPFKSLLDSLPRGMTIKEGDINTIREEFDQVILDLDVAH